MTETIAGRRRLGRGLEALLGPTREEAEREGSLVELAIAEIRPNPYQPRRDVDPAALAELKASILKAGLLQPVVVRTAPGERGSGFELIAGERRLRACQALGWDRIPAVKRDVDARTVLTLAQIGNLQRDALSPVDEARGYERLIAEFNLTHQDVADAVGRDRSTVANALRLLKLPAGVLALLHEGRLSVGHARALLALDDPRAVAAVAKEAVDLGLSVRDVEDRVRGGRAPVRRPRLKQGLGQGPAVRAQLLDRRVARLEEENGRVQQLAAALNRAEANYQELRQLLGVKAPPEKVVARPDLPRALTVRARAPGAPPRFASDSATPLHWPLADGGFLTRGQVGPGDPAESHPGIDIAVPTGTAVRAAAAGVVAQAGTDPAYGLFVLLRHTAGYETMYGHASRLVVREGDSGVAGA